MALRTSAQYVGFLNVRLGSLPRMPVRHSPSGETGRNTGACIEDCRWEKNLTVAAGFPFPMPNTTLIILAVAADMYFAS